MADVIEWRRNADAGAALAQVVRTLQTGGLVALPTDTCYAVAVAACCADAMKKLAARSPQPSSLLLAVRDATDALAWFPDMSPLAQRLARRCWPGPLEIALPAVSASLNQLGESVRQNLVT